VNGRLYFTNTEAQDGPHPLYFIDVETGTQTTAGNLVWRNASGVFAGGAYWYVPQNEGDNLYQVTFDAMGNIASQGVACPTFAGGTAMFYGDLAFRDGLIYGSARVGGDAGKAQFFSLNPGTCDYVVRGETDPLLQLAFDCYGNLIGHATHGDAAGDMYVVDPADGGLTPAGLSENRYNDLSDGMCVFETRGETAWGAGTRFVQRGNWATYFYYQP
jgi:hypothetical protein